MKRILLALLVLLGLQTQAQINLCDSSYSDNIADPTVQIIRTREIDMRILKG